MDESKLDESKQDTNQGETGQEVQKNDQPLDGGNENDDDYGDEGYWEEDSPDKWRFQFRTSEVMEKDVSESEWISNF